MMRSKNLFEPAAAHIGLRAAADASDVGPLAGEVLGALAFAVHAHPPSDHLEEMTFAYPTFHRAIKDALSRLP